jgi:hypothetical protein
MAFYKVTMKGGHVGAGKSFDFVRFYEAQDMLSAFLNAMTLSRVKKDRNGTGIYSIENISTEDFLKGKRQERQNPYLQRWG